MKSQYNDMLIMANLIPQDFISELLSHTDIVAVIGNAVDLKKTGKNFMARCPFHDEKTPSFSVNDVQQFYHCFGCGAHGSAISFMMDYNGMGFVEAVEELASRTGLQVPRVGGSIRSKGDNVLYDLMELVVQYFCRQLQVTTYNLPAIEYLEHRALSKEIIKEFELGFAPPGFDKLLKSLGTSKESRQRLVQIGMLIDKDSGGHYDRFRDRIIFPIRDQRGRAVGFGGRVMGDGEPKYLNSPETSIFKKRYELYGLFQARHMLKNIQRVYLVEGYMDVLALAQYGVRNVVASLGTSVTEEHLQKLYRHCKQIVFCFDGDDAGRKAARRAIETVFPLLKEGRHAYFMFMPDGHDPDTYIQKYGREKFEDVTNWVPLSDYLLDTFKQEADLNSREGIGQLVDSILALVAKLPSSAFRELLLQDIASIAGMNIYVVNTLLEKQKILHQKQPLLHNIATISKTSGSRWPTHLVTETISVLLHNPALATTVEVDILDGIELQGVGFLRELLALIHKCPKISCAGILEHWRDSKYEKRLKELSIKDNLFAELDDMQERFVELIEKIKQNYKQELRGQDLQQIGSKEDVCKLFPDVSIGMKD